jgi:TRAP-type mannitol/chloroaromatic compound transport system permease small subunit
MRCHCTISNSSNAWLRSGGSLFGAMFLLGGPYAQKNGMSGRHLLRQIASADKHGWI